MGPINLLNNLSARRRWKHRLRVLVPSHWHLYSVWYRRILGPIYLAALFYLAVGLLAVILTLIVAGLVSR
jgi:hypothetical protein